jgi:RNA polymerase sigma-70 factor (ECF subfamily)
VKRASAFFSPKLVVDNARPSRADDCSEAERFRQTILPFLGGAYSLARYITRDPVLSEDVVQDAFVRAFQSFPQLRGDSPRAWLFAIVRNCCRTAMSRQAGAKAVHESDLSDEDSLALHDHADPAPTPEDSAIRNGEIAKVKRAVEALPEPFREALVLREMEGLSYGEIAEVKDVAIGTVMSRLSRARSMLADILVPPSQAEDQSSRSAK